MLALRTAARHGVGVLTVVGCLALLLADSAGDQCKSIAINQAYDLTVHCTEAPESVTTYSGRVRVQGDLENLEGLSAVNESGNLEFFRLQQNADCAGEDETSTVGGVQVLFLVDASGAVTPGIGGPNAGVPQGLERAYCNVGLDKRGVPVSCEPVRGGASRCQVIVTAVP